MMQPQASASNVLSSRKTMPKMNAQMLDTIAIAGAWPLRVRLNANQLIWIGPGRVVKGRTDESGKLLKSVECSIAKLWLGQNGKVLVTQDDLDAALAKLHGILSAFAEVPTPHDWKAYRLDMTWNFRLPATALIYAHSPLRIPGIQKAGTLFSEGEGVSWRGSRSQFVVRLYDKTKKMRTPGSVLRAEISLRGKQLARRFKGDWRNVNDLYQAYRSIMVSIPPIKKNTAAACWPDAIAPEPPETRNRILARMAQCKSKGTIRRIRRETEAAAARLPQTFSWADELPQFSPPTPVNVEQAQRYSKAIE